METRPTIRSLVESAQTGDRAAFDELVAESRPALEATLRATLSPDVRHVIEIEDALQETFARAFASVGDFVWRGDGSFSAWIRGIARNIVVDAIRKKRPTHGLQLAERVAADHVSPSRAVRRDERFQRLEHALEELSPAHREVLTLARLEGLPIREIAARMQRSPDAVKQLLSRALKALRASFGDTESLHLPERPIRGDGGRDGS